MIVNQGRQEIYTFNDKPGQMSVIDIRQGKIMETKQLHQEDITAACLSPNKNTLICGFKDGVVKVYDFEDKINQREQFTAFSVFGGKKGMVTQISVNPQNGGLFASSLTGQFKLLRLRV